MTVYAIAITKHVDTVKAIGIAAQAATKIEEDTFTFTAYFRQELLTLRTLSDIINTARQVHACDISYYTLESMPKSAHKP